MAVTPNTDVILLAALCAGFSLLACDGGDGGTGTKPAEEDSLKVAVRPGDGEVYFFGDTVTFEIEIVQPAGKAITGADTIVWRSDRDGELGVGARLATMVLSEGVHTITVRYTLGQWRDSVARSITVRPYESVDIYVGGGSSNEGAYWVNGVWHRVDSAAGALMVAAGEGTVCLWPQLGGGKAGYLRNGTWVRLPASRQVASVADVCVSGNTVHAVGREGDPGDTIFYPCYWRDTVRQAVPDAFGEITAVHVVNGSTYLAGRLRDNPERVLVWLDGVLDTIGLPTSEVAVGTVPLRIYRTPERVWVAGLTSVLRYDFLCAVGWYWPGDGGTIQLMSVVPGVVSHWALLYATPCSGWLYGYGADLYAVGISDGSFYLWKNGSAEMLFPEDTLRGRFDPLRWPYAICVHHNQVFLAGKADGVGWCYWRDGHVTALGNPNMTGFQVYSIAVKDR